MKTILTSLLFVASIAITQAKMISKVNLSKVHSVKVSNEKIIIIGDGIFQSRMVTTESEKDSNFVIQGQPSSSYTAQAYAVTFTLQPRQLLKIPEFAKEHQRKSIQTYNDQVKKKWQQTLTLAKLLKKGSTVSINIKGDEVVFKKGRLSSVSGSGNISK